MKTTATPSNIADRFVGILREWLTPDEWQAMCAANQAETNRGICHSHDYCDANMAMLQAFESFGLPLSNVADFNVDLWNTAWEAAMPALSGQDDVYCDFCHTAGHDVIDCPNVDEETVAIEIARRASETN